MDSPAAAGSGSRRKAGCRMTPAENKLPELETACAMCAGKGGWRREDDSWAICPDCNGHRLVPTDFGRELLDFIRKNLEM
jgi:hypothetical protein